jgi:tRNA (cmo5U34)-methyltransferase
MSDTGYAPETWTFDGEVTRVFDDMLQRSIPQYDVMREIVTDVASAFAKPGTMVVDIGCSRGEALLHVIKNVFQEPNFKDYSFVGAEISEPMIQAARASIGHWASIVSHDLRKGYPAVDAPVSVTLSVLTLMFVPINYRRMIVSQAAKKTRSGGAFVLVEKVLGSNTFVDDILQASYHLQKTRNGYSPDDVNRKRLSLEGVLVPLEAEWNEQLLRRSGFSDVECFWGWGPFRAWVGVKP